MQFDMGWLEFFCAVLGSQGVVKEAQDCFTGPKREEKRNRERRFNRKTEVLDPVGISWV